MILYIMRHAEAANGFPDEARPLTERGRTSVGKLAEFLKDKPVFRPETIYHSNLLRAIQTSQLLAEELGMTALLREQQDLTPESSLATAIELIDRCSTSMLLVGHNPHLSCLANYLIGGEIHRYSIDLKKTDLLCLERIKYVVGADRKQTIWTVRWMVTEKLLG